MRHRKTFNHLSRKAGHRKAMLANMATSLIIHKRIETTTAKAKALRMYVEPLITKSKNDSTHSRRVVFSYLQNKDAVNELFREVSVKVATRPGGYTRILKTGHRLGDNADMCIIELVDYNENLLAASEETKAKAGTGRRRRRRGGGKGSTSDSDSQQAETKKADTQKSQTDGSAPEKTEEQTEKQESAQAKEEVVSDAEVIEEEKQEEKEPEAKAEEGSKPADEEDKKASEDTDENKKDEQK